jgi:hypothetical protein
MQQLRRHFDQSDPIEQRSAQEALRLWKLADALGTKLDWLLRKGPTVRDRFTHQWVVAIAWAATADEVGPPQLACSYQPKRGGHRMHLTDDHWDPRCSQDEHYQQQQNGTADPKQPAWVSEFYAADWQLNSSKHGNPPNLRISTIASSIEH